MNDVADFDVAIIGAGPSGSVSAALLHQQGFQVCVIERTHFPRFVIGESLLPYSINILEEADLVRVVQAQQGFQYKNGAAFTWGERYTWFEIDRREPPKSRNSGSPELPPLRMMLILTTDRKSVV